MTFLTALILAQGLTYPDVKPIVDARCAGPCHNGDGSAFFLPFQEFGEIKGNDAQMIRMIETDQMPQGEAPGFKTSADGKKLLEWLKTGKDLHPAPSDQCPAPPPPHILMKDPRVLTYQDVKPIIDRHCVGCHNPDGRMARKPFTTLAGIRRHAADAWERLDEGRMPEGDAEFRFTAEGRALMGWLRFSPELVGGVGGDDDGVGDDD